MTMLIEEHEVTAANLSLGLDRPVIQHVLKENKSIDVTEDGLYPFWIDIYKSLGFISFKTHTYFKTTCGHLQRLKLCNDSTGIIS